MQWIMMESYGIFMYTRMFIMYTHWSLHVNPNKSTWSPSEADQYQPWGGQNVEIVIHEMWYMLLNLQYWTVPFMIYDKDVHGCEIYGDKMLKLIQL